MTSIPEGFQPHFRKSPATEPWEPLFSRQHDDAVELCFEVRTAHCNGRGFLHGGVLAALCDNAMGLTLGAALKHPSPSIVTVSLSLDYVGSAQVGERVLISPRCLRAASGIGFCDALVRTDERLVARASASFRVRLADEPK